MHIKIRFRSNGVLNINRYLKKKKKDKQASAGTMSKTVKYQLWLERENHLYRFDQRAMIK